MRIANLAIALWIFMFLTMNICYASNESFNAGREILKQIEPHF